MAEPSIPSVPAVAPRDPYPVAARKLLRETLLDSALEELGSREWDDITMADIARTAGVSRQTLYKEFGSRDEFSQAFVLREGEKFLAAVEGAILGNRQDPHLALRGAFSVFLNLAAENPLVRSALVGDGAASILPLVTTQGEPVVAFAAARLGQTISTGWPEADDGDVALLSECLGRLAISYLALPKGTVAETSEAVTSLLDPFIERALAYV